MKVKILFSLLVIAMLVFICIFISKKNEKKPVKIAKMTIPSQTSPIINVITSDQNGNIAEGTNNLSIKYLNIIEGKNGNTTLNNLNGKYNLNVNLSSEINGNFTTSEEIIKQNQTVKGKQTIKGEQIVKGSQNGNTQIVKGDVSAKSIQTDSFNLLPKGVIIMWSNSQIPTGWYVCDGTNGTPNLKDRFVVSTGSDYNLDDKGGLAEVTLKVENLPSHDHSAHNHNCASLAGTYENNRHFANCKSEASTGSAGGKEGTTSSHNNMPPYIVLYYIMKG